CRSFRFGRLQFSGPCRPAGGDSRPSSPTGRSPQERAASPAPQALRPIVVGSVVAILVGLAPVPADGSARYGHPLAPESFRLVLDQEIAAPPRKTGRGGGDSRSNSAQEPSQPLVGDTPHSRGTAQVRVCGGAIDGDYRVALSAEAASPDYPNLPTVSSHADACHLLFHRAVLDLPRPG